MAFKKAARWWRRDQPGSEFVELLGEHGHEPGRRRLFFDEILFDVRHGLGRLGGGLLAGGLREGVLEPGLLEAQHAALFFEALDALLELLGLLAQADLGGGVGASLQLLNAGPQLVALGLGGGEDAAHLAEGGVGIGSLAAHLLELVASGLFLVLGLVGALLGPLELAAQRCGGVGGRAARAVRLALGQSFTLLRGQRLAEVVIGEGVQDLEAVRTYGRIGVEQHPRDGLGGAALDGEERAEHGRGGTEGAFHGRKGRQLVAQSLQDELVVAHLGDELVGDEVAALDVA